MDEQAMLEYLMEIGALQPEQEQVNRQRETVAQLRGRGAMPGMRQMPGMVQAAHPLEFLGSLASTGLGEYKNRQADKAQDAYGQKRRDALGRAVAPRPAAATPGINGAATGLPDMTIVPQPGI